MPTEKPRIQVTLNKDTDGMLSLLAKRQDKSKSAMAGELIEEAMELHEDAYWIRLIKEREGKKGKKIKYSEDIWK